MWANEYRDLVSQAYLDFMGYELDARRVSQFHPLVIPGLLQTEAYATALVTGAAVQPLTGEEIEGRVRMRMARQRELFHREDMAELTIVLDESAVGGEDVMREQLKHLLTSAEHDHVELRLIPWTAQAHPGLAGSFSLLEFHSTDDPDVVYLDNAPDDVALVDNPTAVDGYKRLFRSLLTVALNPHDTTDFLGNLLGDA